MKMTTIIRFTGIVMAFYCAVGVSFAGERAVVIEMADGNHVVFAATREKTDATEAATAHWERRTAARAVQPKPRVVTFEMGEGGLIITFPMTANEIAAEDAAIARRRALRAAKAREPEPKVVKIELPESGHYIVFPVTETGNARPAGIKTTHRADN